MRAAGHQTGEVNRPNFAIGTRRVARYDGWLRNLGAEWGEGGEEQNRGQKRCDFHTFNECTMCQSSAEQPSSRARHPTLWWVIHPTTKMGPTDVEGEKGGRKYGICAAQGQILLFGTQRT
jgi:hypothetical protein